MNGNALPAICGKSACEFHSLHRSKAGCGKTAGLFCLEDPDQQNDDQNDQENGANSDVHAPPSFRGRLLFSGGFDPQTRSHRSKKREETSLDPRLEGVSPRFFLRVAFAALVLAALLGALAQLAAGRRPVLLGGQTV
jgi:hypothetical protein